MGKWMIAVASIFAWATDSPARSALVVSGRCDDPDLAKRSHELAPLLREQMGQQLLEPENLTSRLPPSASRTPAELERQLDGAELQYFEAGYAAADHRVQDALAEVEHLKPGPKRWQLYVRGLLLRALILRARNRPAEAAGQLRRVLRLDPNYRLDSDRFPPSARGGFERLRRQLLSEPKAALAVTSTPAGGEIFVDGLDVQGSTPATLELVPGRYSIAVSKDGRFSFPRVLELRSSSSVHFDLDFESSFRPALVPCFEDAGDEPLRLKNAAKLGSWLGAEEVVLIRSDRRSAGDTWLSATLVQVESGRKVREGGIKADFFETGSKALQELADFISTGKAAGNVVATDLTAPLSPPEYTVAVAKLDPVGNLPVPEQVQALASLGAPSKRWPKLVGASLIGLGTLAVGSGMLFQIRSDQSWASLNRRYSDGTPPPISELPSVRSIRRQADWQRRAALISYALGAAAVGSGLLFILNGSAEAGGSSKASIRAAPGAVSIAGSWY